MSGSGASGTWGTVCNTATLRDNPAAGAAFASVACRQVLLITFCFSYPVSHDVSVSRRWVWARVIICHRS